MNVPLRSSQVRGVGGPARYREWPGPDRVELHLVRCTRRDISRGSM